MNTGVLTALIGASAAVLTAVVALVLNHRAFTGLENRLTAMDSNTNSRFIALENRIQAMDSSTNARFIALENRIHADMQDLRSEVRDDIKILTGKVVEVDNRLTRLEERLSK
jgi:hypothetical protein